MSETPSPGELIDPRDMPDSLRRLLVIFGYAVAIGYWDSLVLAFAGGRAAHFPGLSGGLWLRVSQLAILAAAALLPVGIAGLQLRKRWARTVLSLYAALWILGMLVMYVGNYLAVHFFISSNHPPAIAQVPQVLAIFAQLTYVWAYPALILVCVRPTQAWRDRIRRLLIVGGYVLAIPLIVSTAAWSLQYGWRISAIVGGAWPNGILSTAAVLLLAGTIGFQHRQRWARPLLYASAVVWIVAVLGFRLWMYLMIGNRSMPYSTTRPTTVQTVSTITSWFLWPLIEYSIYPIFLIVCLRMREMREIDPSVGRGFIPVLAVEESGAGGKIEME